jgi:hypothetical protein
MRSGISAMEKFARKLRVAMPLAVRHRFRLKQHAFCLLTSVSQLSAINYQHHVPFGSFSFEVIGGSLRTRSSRRRSKSSEIFA